MARARSDPPPPDHPGVLRTVFKGPTGRVTCVAIGEDGTVAAGGADKAVHLWDPATGKERRTLQHSNTVLALAFSTDGKKLAAGDADGLVLLWDVGSGEKLTVLKGIGEPIRQVALAADGKTAAAGGAKSGRVWDVNTGKEKMTFDGRFALSPDGASLAVVRPNGTVSVWDVPKGKQRTSLEGHTGNVFSLTFSPDGKTLATGGADRRGRFATGKEEGQDNTIKLWDMETGKSLAALMGHVKGIYSLTFAPDGKTLVAADFNGSMKLWDLEKAKVRATLEQVKVGGKLQGTPVGFWAVAPDLKSWAVGTGQEVRWLDIAEFTGTEK
jgi:WD40 repeat protein